MSGEPQPRAFGYGNWDELHHRRNQDFTMDAVHVVRGMAAGQGGKLPSGAQGQSPGRRPLGTKSQKLKKNVKLVYNF